jgi:hypothetical protein
MGAAVLLLAAVAHGMHAPLSRTAHGRRRALMMSAGPPAPVAAPAAPLLDASDDWLSGGTAAAKLTGVQRASVVALGTTVRVPDGHVLERADEPACSAPAAEPAFELVAGPGETVAFELALGRAYALRLRDADGRTGPVARVSAHDGGAAADSAWLRAVPRAVGHAAAQASVSLLRAVERGELLVRCDALLPGLNPRIESACALDERLLLVLSFELARALLTTGRTVMLLSEGAGAAASARAAWAELYRAPPPAALAFNALSNKPVTRDEVYGLNLRPDGGAFKPAWDFTPAVSAEAPRDAYVCVRPRNSRGDAVVLALMQAQAKVSGATWLLVNPELDDGTLRATFGLRETDRYAAFLARFAQVYLARGMYLTKRPAMTVRERGHVGMRYGLGWEALKRTADGFAPLATWQAPPSAGEIDGLSW